MSLVATPLQRTAVITRLREAGCVFAEEEAQLLLDSVDSPAQLDDAVRHRADGMPLEYVLGWAGFCDLRLQVEAGVFIPRRRTEFLAATAATLTPPGGLVLDLCCGSGAVGRAIAAAVPGITLIATDIDPAAVACANRNLAGVGRALQGDLFAPVPESLLRRIDVVVANAPYVPTDKFSMLPAEARDHEPVHTLDGGPNGTSIQRRIAADAAAWLAPNGHVLIETSRAQAPIITTAFAQSGLTARTAYSADHEATVVIGWQMALMSASSSEEALKDASPRGNDGPRGVTV